MSINIKGKLIKCYQKPIVIDKITNVPKPADFAIQILSEVNLRNSTDTKLDLIDIKIKAESVDKYKSMINKDIEISCSTFSKSPIYISEI